MTSCSEFRRLGNPPDEPDVSCRPPCGVGSAGSGPQDGNRDWEAVLPWRKDVLDSVAAWVMFFLSVDD